VVVDDGDTLVLPLPLPSRVIAAAPLLRLTEARGVPPATDIFVDVPLHIAAVPVIVAVGIAFTVTVGLPVADCEQPDKDTVAV